MSFATRSSNIVFKVVRSPAELVPPSKPTPYEFKQLSDIDDQEGFRFQIPIIQFYRNDPKKKGRDPAKVIKKGIAEALVFYYPFAGRLREGPGRKLFVECTGEGIIFIEADADISLNQLCDSDGVKPPIPCFEELLYDIPNSGGIVDCPLLLIQVTRLRCGGFIFAIRLNHTMSDGAGIVQFMMAIGELARGTSTVPSILPIWQRALLNARDPPMVTCNHREYEDTAVSVSAPPANMVLRSFFFDPMNISNIRKTLPSDLRHCTTFELITACIWRCRTIALQPKPEEIVRVCPIVNARSKFNPIIPLGYYGNVFAYPAAITTVENLLQNPLGYSLNLIRNAKSKVTEEYMKSLADFLVLNRRPLYSLVNTYIVSDLTKSGMGDVDYGWGKGVHFCGPPIAYPVVSFYTAFDFENNEMGKGTMVPMCLPAPAMKRFSVELHKLLENTIIEGSFGSGTPNIMKSAL